MLNNILLYLVFGLGVGFFYLMIFTPTRSGLTFKNQIFLLTIVVLTWPLPLGGFILGLALTVKDIIKGELK